MFKSEAKKIVDFRTINIFDLSKQIVEVKNEIIQALTKITNKHSEYIIAEDCVRKGDLVTLNLRSTSEKYNKTNLPVVVGAGLFDKTFEEKLVNRVPNEVNSISLNGENIETSITKIERKVTPKLSDELVKNEGISGVSTAEDYKEYLFDTIVSERARKLAHEVINKVIDRSEFKIAEDDINRLFEGDLSRMRFLSKEEGKVIEEMTEWEIGVRIGEPSLEKFEEVYKNERYPYSLKLALVGLSMAKEDNQTFNETTYEKFLQQDNNSKNYSLSESKQLIPYFGYLVTSYDSYATKRVSSFFEDSFYQNSVLIK
ncbi:hypothetical protein NX029_11715 [Cytobacillus firmus]|nr:hypothetical protein [Cytobacillus firmus]